MAPESLMEDAELQALCSEKINRDCRDDEKSSAERQTSLHRLEHGLKERDSCALSACSSA